MQEPDPTPELELKLYHGNCHCGAFKFSVELPEIKSVTECNCSICFRKGYKWVFPGVGCFTVTHDEAKLKDYEFGVRSMTHKFCSVCGTGVYGIRHNAPPGMDMSLNVRTLRDIDLWSIPVAKTFNAAALPPIYLPTVYEGPSPDAKLMNPKIYTGSCHCGAVTMALKVHGTLGDGRETVEECDCSICSRNGETFLLPSSPLQLSISNSASLTSYVFGRNIQSHEFCPVCGVSVYIQKFNLRLSTFQKWFPSATSLSGTLTPTQGLEAMGYLVTNSGGNSGTMTPNSDFWESHDGIKRVRDWWEEKREEGGLGSGGEKSNVPVKMGYYKEGEREREKAKERHERWTDSMPVNLRCFEGVEWDGVKIKRVSRRDAEPTYQVRRTR